MNKNELCYYIVFSIIAIIGFAFMSIGIIFDNFFKQKKYVLFYRYFGLIIFSIAVISIVSILLISDEKNKRNQINDLKCKKYLNNLDEIITDDINNQNNQNK